MAATPVHTLHHHCFSVCSIMVRYTVALRGPPKDKASEIPIQDQSVDIFHEEQLSEHFLCNVNPKGQVISVSSSSTSPRRACQSKQLEKRPLFQQTQVTRSGILTSSRFPS